MSRFALVVTRRARAPESAARFGRLTGAAVAWVRAARRWGLVREAGVTEDAGPVRGCVVIAAQDAGAATRLAAGYPVPTGYVITVVELTERGVA